MKTYKVINGWAGDAGIIFHKTMAEKVKEYDQWNHKEVEAELFNQCDERLNTGESMTYEISRSHTRSGNTEIVFLSQDDFSIEDREFD